MAASGVGDGLWVPKVNDALGSTSKGIWYFIDANRVCPCPTAGAPHPIDSGLPAQAYRGPVTKDTLHFLYSTKAITPNTYAYSEEHSTNRAWTRIRKIPSLSEELERPLPSQASEAEGSLARVDGNRNPGASANGARAAASSPAPAAPLAANSPMVATPRANVTMVPQTMQAQDGVKLSPFFSGAASGVKPKGGGGFFKKKPGKWHFGQPIGSVALGADGVPEALTLLRQVLWGQRVDCAVLGVPRPTILAFGG